MNNVRTVSETKRAFYTLHTRPINSIYRRVVEELMVEMHLLSVNADFRYDSIYALGVVTAFERFMQGYRPEQDIESIFSALCQSIQADPYAYRQSAEQVKSDAAHFSVTALMERVTAEGSDDGSVLVSTLRGIKTSETFKYSRLFAIGLYTLLETMDGELVKSSDRCNTVLEELSQALNLAGSKLQKDLEIYRSNLDKIAQAKSVMEDILKADRKKREERASQKDDAVPTETVEGVES